MGCHVRGCSIGCPNLWRSRRVACSRRDKPHKSPAGAPNKVVPYSCIFGNQSQHTPLSADEISDGVIIGVITRRAALAKNYANRGPVEVRAHLPKKAGMRDKRMHENEIDRYSPISVSS